MKLSYRKARVACLLMFILLLTSFILCMATGGIELNQVLLEAVLLLVTLLAFIVGFVAIGLIRERITVIRLSLAAWLFMLLGVFYGLFNVWVVNNLPQNIVFCSLGACWFIIGIVLLKIGRVS